jgi:DNA-directed RNA polymerase
MLLGQGPGLSRVYEALNALSGTAWRINTAVLDVVDKGEWRVCWGG